MPLDVATETVVHRPRAAVAQYVLDPTRLAEWCGDVVAVRREAVGPVGIGARYLVRSAGRVRPVERIDEVTALVPLQSLSLRTVLGEQPRTLELTLAPEGRNSTLVTMRTTIEAVGRLDALRVSLLGRGVRRAAGSDLARLKTILELDPEH